MESADLENFEDLLVSADTLSWDKWLFLPADEPWHLGSPATTLKFEEVPPEEEGLPDAGIPKFAKEHGLRETLEVAAVQGIVSNAREQKPTATAQDLFIAFKYYWQNDAFIVFCLRNMPTSSKFGDTVSQWLEAEGIVDPTSPGDIADKTRVRELLIAAARDSRAVSYSEMLGLLGHRFTRPKMRALCKTLDAIDADGAAAGEPELAVLVVRESDRLPGQGWWVGVAERHGYKGVWEGKPATDFVQQIQSKAFDFWNRTKPPGSI